jgi:hypothetical protein
MSQNTQYFSQIVERSENKEDRGGNTYATFRIKTAAAVERFNPLTQQTEILANAGRSFTVNAWQSGVDAPWNHIFDLKEGQPVLGTPLTLDVEPYEIDGNEHTRATVYVPDTMDSPTWAKSLDTVLRWDNYTPAGEIALPINVVEATGEKVTEEVKLDV